MTKKSPIVSLVVFLSLFAACPAAFSAPAPASVEQAAARAEQKEESNAYTIGPQNLLQVKIFGEAGINQLYRVDEDGYIKHALMGRVKLGGLTTTEAERIVEEKLSGDYIINPQVNMRCQGCDICVDKAMPDTSSASAQRTVRRIPKRSMAPPANGPMNPNKTRFSAMAEEIVARSQPNARSSGTINTPGADRTPAAHISSTNTSPATIHA